MVFVIVFDMSIFFKLQEKGIKSAWSGQLGWLSRIRSFSFWHLFVFATFIETDYTAQTEASQLVWLFEIWMVQFTVQFSRFGGSMLPPALKLGIGHVKLYTEPAI